MQFTMHSSVPKCHLLEGQEVLGGMNGLKCQVSSIFHFIQYIPYFVKWNFHITAFPGALITLTNVTSFCYKLLDYGTKNVYPKTSMAL